MDNLAEQEKQNAEAQRPEGSEAPFDFDREFTEALGQENPATEGAETEGQVHSEGQGEVEAQQGGQEPQSPSSLLAQRFGLDPERYQSEDEVYEAVKQTIAYREQERQALEAHRQELARYQAYVQQLHSQQSAPQQQAPQPEAPKPWWNPPVYPTEADSYLIPDESNPGKSKWADNTPVEVRQKAEQYLAHRRQWRDKLETDPEAALAPMFEAREQKIYERAKQEAFQEFQNQRVWNEVQTELQRYTPHFYEKDPLTQQVYIDPLEGKPRLNEVGRAFVDRDNWLMARGVADPKLRLQDCLEYVKGNLATRILQEKYQGQGQAPVQQQASPSPAEQQKRALLQRAVRQPNRSGSVPQTPSGPAQNPNLRAADMLLQEMQREGIDYRQALTRN